MGLDQPHTKLPAWSAYTRHSFGSSRPSSTSLSRAQKTSPSLTFAYFAYLELDMIAFYSVHPAGSLRRLAWART